VPPCGIGAFACWLVPLLFKEELYGVTGLCRFWKEAASLLTDRSGFESLPAAMEALWEPPHYEKDCCLILDRALADHSARLVLRIDNIGDLRGDHRDAGKGRTPGMCPHL